MIPLLSGMRPERLAGARSKPPLFRPIAFTLISDRVNNLEELARALRHCDHICTLLVYQRSTIRHSILHRVAILQQLATRVLPMPLPQDHPERFRCFYRQPIRYETQLDILRSLRLLTRHLLSASLSLPVTRALDATRVLTASVFAVVADAVIRRRASDVPSMCSGHIAGWAMRGREALQASLFPHYAEPQTAVSKGGWGSRLVTGLKAVMQKSITSESLEAKEERKASGDASVEVMEEAFRRTHADRDKVDPGSAFSSFSTRDSTVGISEDPLPRAPAYGFDITLSFAVQSQVMQFTDPNLVALRTKVLDYFHDQVSLILSPLFCVDSSPSTSFPPCFPLISISSHRHPSIHPSIGCVRFVCGSEKVSPGGLSDLQLGRRHGVRSCRASPDVTALLGDGLPE